MTVPDSATDGYLLGMYLGDGWVGRIARSARLTLSLDVQHPEILRESAMAVSGVLPGARVTTRVRPGTGCTIVESYGLAWLDLFPQHGPGRKHERRIILHPWQRSIVSAHPWLFLRGLIHSDGCRTVNRFKTTLPSGRVARYAYPRYFFSNKSPDILELFTTTCDALGLRWTRSNLRNVSVAHRALVARMDQWIGPKR